MKILLLTPDNPFPSASGAAIRNFGIIRGLHDVGHQVTLLSFSENKLVPSASPLNRFCQSVHTAPLPRHSKVKRLWKLVSSNQADMEFRLRSAQYQETLEELLAENEFDIIQFSGIELGSYLPVIQASKKGAIVVYDALNAEAELQRVVAEVDRQRLDRLPAAVYSAVQAHRLKQFEREICRSVDAVIAVSEEDRAHLTGHQGSQIYLVPNGIIADDYAPPTGNLRKSDQLIFTGKMDYRPNVDAVEWFSSAVFPDVLRAHPALRFVVVGRNPHPRISALASGQNIEITGWVDSVLPYLHSAALFVVPLRMGSGTRLKILEAMAAGCAVVSTRIGATGLHQELRQAMLIAEDAQAFSQAVVALLADPDLRRKIGNQARAAVRKYYDWSALIPRLLSAYEDIGIG